MTASAAQEPHSQKIGISVWLTASKLLAPTVSDCCAKLKEGFLTFRWFPCGSGEVRERVLTRRSQSTKADSQY